MSAFGRTLSRASSSFARASSSRASTSSLRTLSTSARLFDAAPAASANADPKLTSIVDSIEKLTLLEAAELVKQLKTRLNIQDIAMPSAAPAAAAPAAAGGAGAGAAAAEEDKPKEKTIFTLKLKGLKDAGAKAKVIREVKAINSTMNLVEAKKFVESAPQTLKEGLTKEEAEKLKKAIEEAGGVVELD